MHKDTHEVLDHPVKGVTRLLRKKGEALHPSRFGRPRLMNMKRTMQPRHWSALYQQNPVPDEGLYFTKSDFRFRGALSYSPRENEVRAMAVDLAITEKQVSDRTSITIGIMGWDRTITVPEIIRGRWGTFQIVEAICNALVRWDIEILGIENGQLKHAILPTLLEELQKRHINVAFDDTLTPITDKAARARTLQGYMQQGRWFYVANDTWWDHTKQEMLRFPGGVHDDDVDSQAWLARMCSKLTFPDKPRDSSRTESWKDRLRKDQAGHHDGGGAMAA
jgi:predicted phage terminase large subunit-like protein